MHAFQDCDVFFDLQVYPSRCDLGCVCFVLLIVSPRCEQDKINNLGHNGMDTPVYRVTQEVSDLGLVDLDLRCSIVSLGQ